MTPEERATQIAEGLGSFAAPIVKGWLVSEIEKAIRAAVEAERERCAQVAEEYAGPFGGVGRLLLADDIAAAIRKGRP